MRVPVLPLIAAAIALLACTRPNPEFCRKSNDCEPGEQCLPGQNRCVPKEPDGGLPEGYCVDHGDCEGVCDESTSLCAACHAVSCVARGDRRDVCDESTGACVECLGSDDCDPDLPVCENRACRACASDAECAARAGETGEVGVCVAGACLRYADVLVVDREACTTGTEDGSAERPYCEIQAAVDAFQPATHRAILIKPGPAFQTYRNVRIEKSVVVVGAVGGRRPTVSAYINSDPALQVSGAGIDATVRRLEIDGGGIDPAANKPTAWCVAATCRFQEVEIHDGNVAVAATNGAMLELDRAYLYDGQVYGLRTTSSSFRVTNSIFYRNGRGRSGTIPSYGAAWLGDAPASGMSVRIFSHNTLFANDAQGGGQTGGVTCEAPTTVLSSILWQNSQAEVTGCRVEYSVIDDSSFDDKDGNSDEDPRFVSITTFPGGLHIASDSPARDAGKPEGAPLHDHFGQPRDATPDIGADEYGDP